jgi:outer membrane protein assembly factor BamB
LYEVLMLKRTLPVAGLLALALGAAAADWPQWQGPRRDNVSQETGLLKEWPSGGPHLVWTAESAGIGYSGPAVVGDRLYTLGADERQDLALAFDTTTGKKLWSTPVGPYVRNQYGSGPRSTPTVDGEYLYVLGSAGRLACLKAGDGALVWSVDLIGQLGGGKPYWNYSESPLVDGDQVVCTPGGARGTLAALDKKTGKVLWRSKGLTDPAGYSSCVLDETGDVRQYVQQTMRGTAGVSAKDGAVLWNQPNSYYKVAVIPTPIVHENYVYAVAGYGAGASLLELTRDGDAFKVRNLYDDDARRAMDNKHGGVVRVGDHVYGWSDHGNQWVCQEFKTGRPAWTSRALGRGSVTCADGCLYLYSEDKGTAVLALASPDGFSEKGRFVIPRQTSRREFNNNHWTHPVVANGKLYLRDQELLFCYDVKNGGQQ